MRNRGNGKGGGIAACGLAPEDVGVSREVLEESYILQVALLDPAARRQIEKKYVEPCFDVSHGGLIPTVDDYRDVPLLEIRPPDVARYFVRVKKDVLDRFAAEKGLSNLERTGNRRRVRLPELREVERRVLRLPRRKARVCHVPRAKPHHHQDRGLRRGRGSVLQDGGRACPRLDRPSALSHAGPRVASGRGASVYRHERSPCPQRGLRQLPFRLRVPRPAQPLPPVSDGHRGLGHAVRPDAPRVQVSGRVHHRSARADHGTGFRPALPRTGSESTGRSRLPICTVPRTAPGFSSSPGRWPRRRDSSSWASRTPPCCGPRYSRCRKATRCPSA